MTIGTKRKICEIKAVELIEAFLNGEISVTELVDRIVENAQIQVPGVGDVNELERVTRRGLHREIK